MPIQSRFCRGVKAIAEIFPEYQAGLKDIEKFSHLILIYQFHKMTEEKLVCKPFLEDIEHGVFAVRSPYRPNRIGFSIVRLKSVNKNSIEFTDVDTLDGTPLLDIKPYISFFDERKGVKNGWVAKHFKNKKIPKRVRL